MLSSWNEVIIIIIIIIIIIGYVIRVSQNTKMYLY